MQNRKEAAEQLQGRAQIQSTTAQQINWMLELRMPMSREGHLQHIRQLIRLYKSVADLQVASFNLYPANTTPLLIAETFYQLAIDALSRIEKSSELMNLSLFAVREDLKFFETDDGNSYRQALIDYYEGVQPANANPAPKQLFPENEREDEERPTRYQRSS
jgi:hypothetical protein